MVVSSLIYIVHFFSNLLEICISNLRVLIITQTLDEQNKNINPL